VPRTMRLGTSDFQRVPTRWRWRSQDKRAVEVFPDRPIQIPHEPDLFQRGKVSEHELAEPVTGDHHRFPVTTDVGQSDVRGVEGRGVEMVTRQQ